MTDGVRTYHARRGRLGPTVRAALHTLLPSYGVPPEGDRLDPAALFDPPRPAVLEIGCGKGDATLALARAEPQIGVLAVDVHIAGIAAILSACAAEHLPNVRVVPGDAVTLLRQRIPRASLAGIRVFFPDPWPKARHAKRRLIRPDLVRLLAARLEPGGVLHTATDHPGYAEVMLAVLGAEPLLANCSGRYTPRPAWRPLTGYERTALEQGREVRDLMFRRVPSATSA